MTVVKNIYLFAGETQFVTGEVISANLSTGEAKGANLTGVLGQGVKKATAMIYQGYLSQRMCPLFLYRQKKNTCIVDPKLGLKVIIMKSYSAKVNIQNKVFNLDIWEGAKP